MSCPTLLGHADLSSTQVYTHVAIQQLTAIRNLMHPTKMSADLEKPDLPPPPAGGFPPPLTVALLGSLELADLLFRRGADPSPQYEWAVLPRLCAVRTGDV